MNLINTPKTMSSREIASLTNCRHDAVKKSAERLAAGNLITSPLADTPYTAENKQTYYEYNFNKRDSLVVVARLSPEFTAAVVDRWQELESNQVPQTYAAALLEAGRLALENEALQEKAKENAPKVEFYEQVTGSTDTVDMAQAAKVLNMGIGRNKLFELLRDKKVLQHNNQPYQTYIDRGYFRMVESKFQKPTGDTHISIKTVVYQKGLEYIRKLIKESKK
jgi:phage antirepressor YoqD-like protein